MHIIIAIAFMEFLNQFLRNRDGMTKGKGQADCPIWKKLKLEYPCTSLPHRRLK